MKKYTLIIGLSLALLACTKDKAVSKTEGDKPCGRTASGQHLFIGPKDGCFYYNTNGNKTYVDKAECKC